MLLQHFTTKAMAKYQGAWHKYTRCAYIYVDNKETTVHECKLILKGKTIYTTGKGTTPEYTLKISFEKGSGIDAEKDVTY